LCGSSDNEENEEDSGTSELAVGQLNDAVKGGSGSIIISNLLFCFSSFDSVVGC
jgi:hypothetical protein